MLFSKEKFDQLMSMNNFMIDFETLDTAPTACILSVAVTQFRPLTGEIFNSWSTKVNLQSCLDNGGTIDASTLAWWLGQDEESLAYFRTFSDGGGTHIAEVVGNVLHCIKKKGQPEPILWCNGASFDFPKLMHWVKKFDLTLDWFNHRNENDCRTLFDLNRKIISEIPREGVKHDPEADNHWQIKALFKILNHIRFNSDKEEN